MARITWKTGKYDGTSGTVGKLSLFTISWKTRREDPKYTLRTTLQGFTSQQWQDDDPKVLEERAERVLAAFVAELGAVFLAEIESPTVADAVPCCDDQSRHNHCTSCGAVVGLMGHYVGGAGGRIICDPQERRAYLRDLVARDV